MRTARPLSLFWAFVLCFSPLIMFGQHGEEPATTHTHAEEEINLIFEILEMMEYVVDLFGIAILLIGFLKGLWYFIKMELDHLQGGDTFDDILQLRSTLGGYIILALDFLIISDIIHSVLKPEFNELINLGIIVVLRTSIGFFLGREIMELHHTEKEHMEFEAKKEEIKTKEPTH